MNPTEQLAHFDGAATDVPMTGLWYSHNRVRELVEAARQECRDRDWDAMEADVRARLADAEKRIAAVEHLAAEMEQDDAVHLNTYGQHLPASVGRVAELLRAALDGGR